MRARRVRRVLIAPREVAGVSAGLQQGLSDLGYHVDLLYRWPHPFAYSSTRPSSPVLRALWWLIGLEHAPKQTGRVARAASLAARVVALPFLARRYQAVVYVGADTLLRGGADRAFVRRAGVRVVTVFCGSDARPPYLNGYWMNPTEGAPDLDAIRAATTVTRARVERAERQSDYVVNHPASAQFHSSAYIDWTVMGMPSPDVASADREPAPTGAAGPVRILHAPSDPVHKGSEQIRAAVAELKTRGRAIDYLEISGLSHAAVLAELRSADVVVDELYSDALLAGLATEAAHLGRAVLILGYAGELVGRLAERVGAPADHYCDPAELVDRLQTLVDDAGLRRDLSERLYEFVSTSWAPTAIAERYGRLIDGNPDPAWFDDPADYGYAFGWGVDKAALSEALAAYTTRFGAGALELPEGSPVRASIDALVRTRGAGEAARP